VFYLPLFFSPRFFSSVSDPIISFRSWFSRLSRLTSSADVPVLFVCLPSQRYDVQTAVALLNYSERHIVIAEEREGGDLGAVNILNKHGLHKSVEAMGEWMVYADKADIVS
jgi:hypothetical protein